MMVSVNGAAKTDRSEDPETPAPEEERAVRAESQCTCTDCAQSEEVISKIQGDYTTIYVINADGEDEENGAYEGDECSEDHNCSKSSTCDPAYKCDMCDEIHAAEEAAEECCAAWECNYCGWKHINSYYASGRQAAAACCVNSCDECDVTGWPDFMSDHSCERNGMGMRRQLPWEARGITVDARDPDAGDQWKATWDIEPENHNVVRAAADYYLLEAMKAGLVGTGKTVTYEVNGTRLRTFEIDSSIANHNLMCVIRDEAAEKFSTLVAEWDPILQAYTHMAVGGELRHHNAVGGEVLSDNRDSAWSGWKLIFDQVGADALTDAAELFNEFGGGSFGGKPWADACLILHKRVTGAFTPALFLDRIFNAQHNGGCLLNKVRWAGDKRKYNANGSYSKDPNAMGVDEMTYKVLPAHGLEPESDYSTLLAYASPDVRALFADCHQYARRAALDLGFSLSEMPARPFPGRTQSQERYTAQVKYAAEAAYQAALPKSGKYAKEADVYAAQAKQYEKYAEDEYKTANRLIFQSIVVGLWGATPKGCNVKGCFTCGPKYDTSTADYYAQIAKSQKRKSAALTSKALEALALEQGAVKTPLWTDPELSDDEPCECDDCYVEVRGW